jgi:hypothetical protein
MHQSTKGHRHRPASQRFDPLSANVTDSQEPLKNLPPRTVEPSDSGRIDWFSASVSQLSKLCRSASQGKDRE